MRRLCRVGHIARWFGAPKCWQSASGRGRARPLASVEESPPHRRPEASLSAPAEPTTPRPSSLGALPRQRARRGARLSRARRPARRARSATSCSRSPRPRAATRRTGSACSAVSPRGCRGPTPRTRVLGWMAKRFGSIFVLALAQNAEGRSPYDDEPFATPAMAADEKIHHEVVRGLAARGRRRLSGTFRAAVFGANDGLVSNLALVMGIGATGVAPQFVLFSGIAGLLAGALSMGAGEFVSVRSQRELLAATEPNDYADDALPDLDLDANELALVYRTRGMPRATRRSSARGGRRSGARAGGRSRTAAQLDGRPTPRASSAAPGAPRCRASCSSRPVRSSRCCPGSSGCRGSPPSSSRSCSSASRSWRRAPMVGLLSGGPPLRRALRQLLIGYGAAAVTYAARTAVRRVSWAEGRGSLADGRTCNVDLRLATTDTHARVAE